MDSSYRNAINRTIGAPYAFRHTMHVVSTEGLLQGLPSEWANEGKQGSRAVPVQVDTLQIDPLTFLPTEIVLQRVFKFLSLFDILCRVAMVSAKWKSLAYHNDLWNNIIKQRKIVVERFKTPREDFKYFIATWGPFYPINLVSNEPNNVFQMVHLIKGELSTWKHTNWKFDDSKRVTMSPILMKHSIGTVTHENIAKYDGIIEIRDSVYLRREYVPGVPLRYLVKETNKFEPNCVLFVLREILKALEFIHTEVRSPLKELRSSEIIVRPNGRIKLLKYTGTDASTQGSFLWQPATSYWVPPEYLKSKVSGSFTDMYSMGIIGYEMSCGHLPYENIADSKLVMQQLLRGPPVMLDVDPAVKQVVYPCLSAEYTQRPLPGALLSNSAFESINEEEAMNTLKKRVRESKYEPYLTVTQENLVYQWVH